MALMDRLRGFWEQYRRDRIGMVGLVLLLVFVFVAVFFPIIGDMNVIRNWDNYQYFALNPRTVPPCWASLFTGEKPSKTIDVRGAELSKYVIFTAKEGRVRGMRVVDGNLSIRVDVTGTKPPQDVVAVLDLRYYSRRTVEVLSFYIVRPDGERFYIIPPPDKRQMSFLRQVGIDMVFKGLPRRMGNYTGYTFRLSSSLQNPMLLQQLVLPQLQAMGLQVGFADIARIQLNLFKALFAKNFTAALSGGNVEALPGTYWWVITLRAYGDNATIEITPRRLVIDGTCYGLLGTDNRGHDLWQGVLYGVRWALIIGLLASTLSVMIGTLYGVTSGYFGGMVDEVMLRVAQIVYSLPPLPILILLAALYRPSIWLIILAIVAFGWPGMVFVTRAMAMQVRQEPYVESAIALGASTPRVIFLYVLPQVLPYVFASIAFAVPGAIITEASLSFLGVGDPSTLTWGRILHEAQTANAALNGYWWWVIPPGLGIALMGLTFVFIGSAMDKILNPRLRR